MNIPRPNKSVERITVLQGDAGGELKPVTIYQKSRKRKKGGSLLLRQLEKVVQNIADAQRAYLDSYQARHDASNRQKRDGWLRDLPVNVINAAGKGAKKLAIDPKS
jgi:hypothetical protein